MSRVKTEAKYEYIVITFYLCFTYVLKSNRTFVCLDNAKQIQLSTKAFVINVWTKKKMRFRTYVVVLPSNEGDDVTRKSCARGNMPDGPERTAYANYRRHEVSASNEENPNLCKLCRFPWTSRTIRERYFRSDRLRNGGVRARIHR